MASIRFAEGQQRSGSIGATVYSHNRFGAYIRARSVPVNPSTSLQAAVRNRLRNLSISWSTTLTAAQRADWNTWASNVVWGGAFGDPVYLTGLNAYIRTNAARLEVGLAVLTNPPTLFSLAEAEQNLIPSGSEATQELSISFQGGGAWISEDDAAQLVYMGLPQNAGRDFFGGPYRFLGAILGDSVAPPANPAVFPAVFPFAETQRIWVRSRILRADGRLSDLAQADFLAAA